MTSISIEDVRAYVKQNIGGFHQAKLAKLRSLKLSEVLRRKNPYLFKAKNITLAQDLVRSLLDAYLSSQEEALFGDFLEGLAVFVCKKVHGGWKSSAQGVDLEFDKDGIRFILTVKSGPNWGNSGQVREMKDNFRKAKQIIRSGNSNLHVVAINGCCYGRDTKPDKGDYYKYCGQTFWEFISGNSDLYLDIIKPLGYAAKKRNSEFYKEYSQIVNRFTSEFSREYVIDGEINWSALVQFNSGKPEPKLEK
jgi:hypothetical protein